MTFKTRLGQTVATMGILLVSIHTSQTLASSDVSGVEKAGIKTPPPPAPFANETAPANTPGNYPPAGFDPEKKAAADGQKTVPDQPAPAQQQWPTVIGNGAPSQEYPPQEGIDLTPAPKTPVKVPVKAPIKAAVKKPQPKYPPFPSVEWPKKKVELPDYSTFPSVEWPKGAKSQPVNPATPPAVTPPVATWGQPPQLWSGPAWSRQPSGPAQADQNKTVEQSRNEMKRQWDAVQAERKAAYEAANAQQSSQRAKTMAVDRAELQKARAAFQAWQAEQEKALKARHSALKRQWETQQAELQRARVAQEAEMKRRADEAQKMFEARQADQRRQFEAFQAEMQKARAAQQAELKRQQAESTAKVSKMLKSADPSPVPPMPPKPAPRPGTRQQIAPVMPGAPRPVPPASQQQNRWNDGSNRQQRANGNWPMRMQPPMGQQWQYRNQMHPAWRYNPYRPQYWAPYQPWPRPYPYGPGPGVYRPR